MTEPFEDRGSWVEFIAFSTGHPYAVPAAAVAAPVTAGKKAAGARKATKRAPARRSVVRKATQPSRTLAYTGLNDGLPALAVGLLATAGLLRRRRSRHVG